MKKFIKTIEIGFEDLDAELCLSLVGITKLLQHIMVKHGAMQKLGAKDMDVKNSFFVLSKLGIKLNRKLRCGEKVKVESYLTCKNINSYILERSYKIYDQDNNLILEACGKFCLLNKNNFEIQKLNVVEEELSKNTFKKSVSFNFIKVNFDESFQLHHTHQVLFGDIDYNIHANNTAYTRLATDVLPFSLLKKSPKFYEVVFIKQTVFGEKIEIYNKNDANSFQIAGICNKQVVFTAKIDF